jgi:riboflavin transporter FmnP
MAEYDVDPIFDKLASPMIVWTVMVFASFIVRILLVTFAGIQIAVLGKFIYADLWLTVLASFWHAWVWRDKAYIQASIIAAIEWPLATLIFGYLLLSLYADMGGEEIWALFRFWDGGTAGIYVIAFILCPLVLGPVVGLVTAFRARGRSSA